MQEEKKYSILVADDHSVNIMALTDILSNEYTIYAAKNGRDTLKAAHKYLPDLILLDVIMPDMDGFAVISSLKASQPTKDIPVIFATGLSSVDDEEKGLSLGAADYINKPFSPAIVKLRVNNQRKILSQFRTIEKLSVTDHLTGIANRRGFVNRIEMEFNRAIREKLYVSIVLMDLDRFKNYNDSYGHIQGDVALREVASMLQASIKRPADFVARWGGEEFIILLPGTDKQGAAGIAEHIRESIETTPIPTADGANTHMTASFGVYTGIPDNAATYESYIYKADKALYRVKRTSRNRVVSFND